MKASTPCPGITKRLEFVPPRTVSRKPYPGLTVGKKPLRQREEQRDQDLRDVFEDQASALRWRCLLERRHQRLVLDRAP